MSKIFTELLYGVNATVKNFVGEFPEERIISASPATLSQFKGQSRMGLARRGVVIFTREQVFFKSVLLSFFSFIYLIAALFGIIMYWRTQSIVYLILGIVMGAMIVQRLPIRKQVILEKIKDAELNFVRTLTVVGFKELPILKLVVQDGVVVLNLQETPSDEVKHILEIDNDIRDKSTLDE